MPQSSVTSAACASVDARVAGERDQPRADAADRLEQPDQLLGLAAVRQREHDVVVADRAEVAVDRLGRVEEEGRRAGARQRRGDLAADDARLAHAGDDDAAAALEQQLDGALEVVVEAIDQAEDRRRLGAQHLAGEIERRSSVVGAHHRGSRAVSRGATAGSAAIAWIRTSRSSSGSSRSRRSAFWASLLARSGPLVDLHEDAVDAGGDAGRRHRLDELRLPGGDAVAGAGQLQAVGDVVDDRDSRARA